jgi:maltooligosyltrehalose trehalohydrolase
VTEFSVWAPLANRLRLQLSGAALPMTAGDGGWWSVDAEAPPGTDYGYLIDDAPEARPDPRSPWQPMGVHGLSRTVDHESFAWSDAGWQGRPLAGAVIYELHIATFTPGGTFDSAIERLDHLVALGISHVEVLPVNAVNGVWNWGYDGVGWYAVHEPLGGPRGFKRFVDACHTRGLAVLLDVVYNHLGPSGNYLPEFGPYLTEGRSTWGDLVNLEEPAVRRFIIENALMWLRDYHLDGLRLDAVHALVDKHVPHLLAELSAEVDALSDRLRRPLPLIAESDLNDPIMIESRAEGGHGLAATWDDDVHHALHALLTGERQAYYVDFGSLAVLAKVVQKAFLHDGTYSTFRGRTHGRPVDPGRSDGSQFVVTLQNHDQIGNRAVGDRLPELVSSDLLRVGALLLMTLPFTPMLFMGEEWAASTRWPFFTSHPEAELGEVVSKGRLDEFAEHGWNADDVVDPQDPDAFRGATLNWDEVAEPEHRSMLEFYRELIALRAAEPDLRDGRLDHVDVSYDEARGYISIRRGELLIAANVGAAAQPVPLGAGAELVLATDDLHAPAAGEVSLPPRSAVVLRDRARRTTPTQRVSPQADAQG